MHNHNLLALFNNTWLFIDILSSGFVFVCVKIGIIKLTISRRSKYFQLLIILEKEFSEVKKERNNFIIPMSQFLNNEAVCLI